MGMSTPNLPQRGKSERRLKRLRRCQTQRDTEASTQVWHATRRSTAPLLWQWVLHRPWPRLAAQLECRAQCWPWFPRPPKTHPRHRPLARRGRTSAQTWTPTHAPATTSQPVKGKGQHRVRRVSTGSRAPPHNKKRAAHATTTSQHNALCDSRGFPNATHTTQQLGHHTRRESSVVGRAIALCRCGWL